MALSDRARDFWDRISPRERTLVVVAGIALPITIAIWLGLSIRDGLISMEDRNDKTRRALVIVEDLKSRGPVQVSDDAVAAIPADPIGLETYVSNAAKKGSLTFKGPIDRHPSPPARNGFVTTSVSCSLDDVTTDQLKAFLAEVESSKVVAVTHIDLHRDFRDKKKLDVTFEVTTYSKPSAASGEGAGSGAGSGDKKGG
jgi:hypothetical protein